MTCCSLVACKISHFFQFSYYWLWHVWHGLGLQNPWTCGFRSFSYGEYCCLGQDIDLVRFKAPGSSLAPMGCGSRADLFLPFGSVLHEWYPVPPGVWAARSVLSVIAMLLRIRALSASNQDESQAFAHSFAVFLSRSVLLWPHHCFPVFMVFTCLTCAHFLWLQPCLGAKEKYSQFPHWFGVCLDLVFSASDSCSMVGKIGWVVLTQT